jgi:hypothetical protein
MTQQISRLEIKPAWEIVPKRSSDSHGQIIFLGDISQQFENHMQDSRVLHQELPSLFQVFLLIMSGKDLDSLGLALKWWKKC